MAIPTPDGLARTYLPSDPDFLLSYMAGIGSDESEDEFDGYLTDEDEPLCGQDSGDETTVGPDSPTPLTSSACGSITPPSPSNHGN